MLIYLLVFLLFAVMPMLFLDIARQMVEMVIEALING